MPRRTTILLLLLSISMTISAQQGPPPEIRGHVQAFIAAFNSGRVDQWEAMAKEHFAPSALAHHSTADRKELFDRMHTDFGPTISTDRVLRQGPDAPLELHVKGASGLAAVILLHLEPNAPFRITRLALNVGAPAEQESQVPAPPVSGSMRDAELARALDAYLAKLATDEAFSGVALVARNGAAVFEKAYGLAEIALISALLLTSGSARRSRASETDACSVTASVSPSLRPSV